jgi:type IV pilus assembly protein PilO
MSSNSRKILFFILLVGMAYVSYAYMIKPANVHLSEQKKNVAQKREKLNELEKAMVTANDLKIQLDKIEEAIRIFESKLPPTNEINTVLKDITLIARKHGLASKTIRTLKIKENRGYIEQPLEMELNGNFNSYYAFLLELEKLDRITKIRELKLFKQSKQEGRTDARFVVSVFFQNTGA